MPRPRILELDGVRGVAIAMVLVYHFSFLQPAHGRFLSIAARFCDQGVDIFFVLSGFLIGTILLEQRLAPNLFKVFYLRRFFRIVPIYYLLLAVYFLGTIVETKWQLGLAPYVTDPNPLPILRYLLFIQNFMLVKAASLEPFWLIVTWSLAIEEQFYLLSPLAIRFLKSDRILGLCGLFCVLCPLIRGGYLFLGHQPLAAIYLPNARVDSLAAGCFVAGLILREGGKQVRPRVRAFLVGAVWVYLAYCLASAIYENVWGRPGWVSFFTLMLKPTLYLVGNAIIVFCLVAGVKTGLERLLRWRPLTILGGISYFVYLFHIPIATILDLWGKYFWAGHETLVLIASGIFTVLVALASGRYLERPLIRYAQNYRYDSAKAGSLT